MKITKCSECGSESLEPVEQGGNEEDEVMCKECGLVMGREFPAERMVVWHQENRMPATTSRIHSTGRSHEKQEEYLRLRPSIGNGTEKRIAYALTELEKIALRLKLPRYVRRTAALVYKKAVEDGLLVGRSIRTVLVACIYLACRETGVSESASRVAMATGVERGKILRMYRFLSEELQIRPDIIGTRGYITRFCSELELGEAVEESAAEILEKVDHKDYFAKNPAGVAAAIVYLACARSGERTTQRRLSEISGISGVTIRKRCREIEKVIRKKDLRSGLKSL